MVSVILSTTSSSVAIVAWNMSNERNNFVNTVVVMKIRREVITILLLLVADKDMNGWCSGYMADYGEQCVITLVFMAHAYFVIMIILTAIIIIITNTPVSYLTLHHFCTLWEKMTFLYPIFFSSYFPQKNSFQWW